MLKKLIKYELISTFKFISIFYILGITFAILTRIFFSIDNSLIFEILGQITTGATISMLVSIIINNLMRQWVKFKNTLYDDEAYLTHTLPISKKTLYLSKFLTSFIVMIISFLVSALILFIAYYSKENIEMLKSFILPITTILNSTALKIIFILIFILFIEIFYALLCGYLGIIIGHRFNTNKILKSVIFGFISYIISQIIVLIIIFLIALFNKDLMIIFTTNMVTEPNILMTLSYIFIVIYSSLIILNMYVSINLFKKGVNLD